MEDVQPLSSNSLNPGLSNCLDVGGHVDPKTLQENARRCDMGLIALIPKITTDDQNLVCIAVASSVGLAQGRLLFSLFPF